LCITKYMYVTICQMRDTSDSSLARMLKLTLLCESVTCPEHITIPSVYYSRFYTAY